MKPMILLWWWQWWYWNDNDNVSDEMKAIIDEGKW